MHIYMVHHICSIFITLLLTCIFSMMLCSLNQKCPV
jgi:hypothetical protein